MEDRELFSRELGKKIYNDVGPLVMARVKFRWLHFLGLSNNRTLDTVFSRDQWYFCDWWNADKYLWPSHEPPPAEILDSLMRASQLTWNMARWSRVSSFPNPYWREFEMRRKTSIQVES